MAARKLKNQIAPEKDAGCNSPVVCVDPKIGRQSACDGIADVVPVHVGDAVQHDEGGDDPVPPSVGIPFGTRFLQQFFRLFCLE